MGYGSVALLISGQRWNSNSSYIVFTTKHLVLKKYTNDTIECNICICICVSPSVHVFIQTNQILIRILNDQ